MPPPQNRSRPFSAKQKKEQLKVKRERKAHNKDDDGSACNARQHDRPAAVPRMVELDAGSDADEKVVHSTHASKEKYDPQRYRLQFLVESKDEIEKRKVATMQPYQLVDDSAVEMDPSAFYPDNIFWDFPKRPAWDYNLTLDQLDRNEQRYFQRYVETMFAAHPEGLSYFEMNLETWRQLWRVLEMSDILLLIADVRFAALHIPRFVCDYVIKELKKEVIIVLNKIDIVPAPVVAAWENFLTSRFPGVRVVNFTSYPKKLEEQVTVLNPHTGKVTMKKKKVRRAPAVGPLELWSTVQDVVSGAGISLADWKQKIEEDMQVETHWDDDSDEETEVKNEVVIEKPDLGYTDHARYKDGIVTIGCIGYPNVGKSSLINGLMGKKVVSVSKTPGHTKHFQTIFLTDTVRLCDCPGLVFPSCVPKQLQVLSGLFPIAQLREPYSSVQYLAERVPVPKLLNLEAGRKIPWSAFDICDAWAEKRGFKTAKTGRTDTYRSANNILQMALQGKLVLCIKPPGYHATKNEWAQSERAREISLQQDQHRAVVAKGSEKFDDSEPEGGAAASVKTSESSDDDSLMPRGYSRASNMFDILGTAENN